MEQYNGKPYIAERYAKKSKEIQGYCMGRPVRGWGMRFYTDKECTILVYVDQFHYIKKDQVMMLQNAPVLVHVVKK